MSRIFCRATTKRTAKTKRGRKVLPVLVQSPSREPAQSSKFGQLRALLQCLTPYQSAISEPLRPGDVVPKRRRHRVLDKRNAPTLSAPRHHPNPRESPSGGLIGTRSRKLQPFVMGVTRKRVAATPNGASCRGKLERMTSVTLSSNEITLQSPDLAQNVCGGFLCC